MLLAGGESLAAEPIPLRAGPLTMVFEPDNAFLRYIKLGSDEVLRGISAPVRNQFWGTVPPQVKIVSLDRQPDHFTLRFDVACRERDVDFHWHGTIEGSADGKLEYTFDGEALTDFKRNRIGFCVLHGETAAGRPWMLETIGGEKLKGAFPESIAPHQPAKDLKAVSHEFAKDRWARVQFEGDVFEMEDQRNWTDASFKTYCTPLAIPYPVQLAMGDKVQQKITIALDGSIPEQAPTVAPAAAITLTVHGATTNLPGIGLQVSSESDELSEQEITWLKALHLDHLRVNLVPADDTLSSRWSIAAKQADALGTKLIAAVHFGNDPDAELKRIVAECRSVKSPVAVWLIIASDQATFQKARDSLKPLFPNAWIGVGEDTNFTELNRKRPDLKGVDVVSFGMNPQVHAFDNASMVETLPIEGDTVRSARRFLDILPLIISPVTLRVQQLNTSPVPGELPANADPRQPSKFAAAWTLGSIKYLAESNVNRVTYFETVGRKGIMAGTDASVPYEKFPARPSEVYPVFHALLAVGEFTGGQVRQTESSQPMSVVGLSLSHGNRHRLMVANLTGQSQSVKVASFGRRASLLHLPQINPAQINLDAPFTLPPYGIAQIDGPVN